MKKFTISFVLMLLVAIVALPVTEFATVLAQNVPAPALPPAPDQAPLWGGAALAAAALVFGVFRLYRNRN